MWVGLAIDNRAREEVIVARGVVKLKGSVSRWVSQGG